MESISGRPVDHKLLSLCFQSSYFNTIVLLFYKYKNYPNKQNIYSILIVFRLWLFVNLLLCRRSTFNWISYLLQIRCLYNHLFYSFPVKIVCKQQIKHDFCDLQLKVGCKVLYLYKLLYFYLLYFNILYIFQYCVIFIRLLLRF